MKIEILAHSKKDKSIINLFKDRNPEYEIKTYLNQVIGIIVSNSHTNRLLAKKYNLSYRKITS